MTSAIIVAAGSSRRMGFDKLTADLNGKPVLTHSIEAFLECREISEIIMVTDEERFELCVPKTTNKPIIRVDGGKERHHSVSNGITACSEASDLIAVHDGARPFITPKAITLCITAARENGAASLAHPITETVKRSDADEFAAESVDRTNLWAMETPQTFQATLLKRAYQTVLETGALVTDEVSAMSLIDIKTKLIANPSENQKITFPSDL